MAIPGWQARRHDGPGDARMPSPVAALTRMRILGPMKRQRFSRWLAAALLASLAANASAETWRDVPYERIHGALTSVKPLPDARYVRFSQRVEVAEEVMPLEDLRMIVGAAAGDIEVPISPEGELDFPITDALLEENPPVRVNAPEGTLSINMSFDISAPPAQRFPYALLEEISDEYDRFIKLQGLMARMAAPKPVGLEVRFPPGEAATATVRGRDTETYEADGEGRLVIPSARKWRAEGTEVELSRLPESLGLAFRE